MNIIFHITSRSDWEAAQASGRYTADTLVSEGFIHCSEIHQLLDVANVFYSGQHDLVLLCIDSQQVSASIRRENLGGGQMLYPHIYGELNLDAIVAIYNFKPGENGMFQLPDGLDITGYLQ